jgi:hypothetical protein
MDRRWWERIFGAIGEGALEAKARSDMSKLAAVESARTRVMTASPYNSPISTFMRNLPTEKKARARFRWAYGDWQMTDREKIRVVKLYKQAGQPGMLR